MNQNNNTSLEVGSRVYESQAMMLSADEIIAQMRVIDDVTKRIMKEGVHYDFPYPGAPKKTLLKPGSEKLLMTFRIDSQPEIIDLSTHDEIRYRVIATGYHIITGKRLGAGVGECSSNEEKFKWRAAVCNEEYDATPEDRRRIKWSKGKSGQPAYNTKQVRTNPADTMNNVLKIADKRANASLTLKVTAASDAFDQDLDEIDHDENNVNAAAPKRPAKKSANKSAKPEGESGFFTIQNVSTKAVGEGGKFTRYTINVQNNDTGDKMRLATIKKEIGDKAQSFAGTGTIVELVFKRGQYDPDLLYVGELIVDEPEEETTETPQAAAPPASGPAKQQSMYPEDDSDLPEAMRSNR